MGEPAWKTPPGESGEPDEGSTGTVLVQRVVERPDGRFELAEWPPTLDDYLNPQLGSASESLRMENGSRSSIPPESGS
jgi:hypothetical protein